MPPDDSPVPTEFTSAIGRTARRQLALDGFTTYAQLTGVTPRQLLAIHGVGPKAVRILGDELAVRGLSFAEHAD